MRLLFLVWSAVALLAALQPAGGVVISEVYYSPSAAEGQLLEFVEIQNPSPEPVSIGGWRLTGPVQFTFPQGTVLPAGAFAVACKDCGQLELRFGGSATALAGNFEGSLEKTGKAIELVDQFNAFVDAVPYDDKLPWPEDADGTGKSLQRNCASSPSWDPLNWSAVSPPSPAGENPSRACPPPSYVLPSVVISEVNYHPIAAMPHPANEDGEDEEFVELHNPRASPVSLGGWRFTAGITFTFPPGISLPPQGYLVVCRKEAKVRAKFGITNTVGDFTGRLSNSGERVALADGQGRFVDAVSYSESGDWPYAADGFGRSLEKVVVTLPGSDPANWSGSRLLASSSYVHLQAEGPIGQGLVKKMVISIDGPGEVLVDNVVLEEVGKPGNVLQNGAFDAGIDGWTASGVASSSVPAPGTGVGGTGALRLISTGDCPNDECGSSNGVSVTVSGLNALATFRVAVDLKYIKGSPHFRAGLFRGASVSIGDISSPGGQNTASGSNIPIFISHVNRYPQDQLRAMSPSTSRFLSRSPPWTE